MALLTNPGSESEHGWLVLGLSVWLFWRNLRIADCRLAIGDSKSAQSATGDRQSPIGTWQSAVAMVAGLGLHAVGFVAQQARISIAALLIFTWGVIALAGLSAVGPAKAGGRRWGAAALFPLAFMVFAIPVNVLDSVGFWLRVWVVEASRVIAHAAGIGVLQSGTQLLAPDGSYNYDVAAACSGIRSLTAMAALSLLAGYLSFRAWWRRGLLLVLCFPLVYLGNVARILAIIFAAEAGGPRWGNTAHEIMGYGVFVIVLGGVMGAASLLRRWRPEGAAGAATLEEGALQPGQEAAEASGDAVSPRATLSPPASGFAPEAMADGSQARLQPRSVRLPWLANPALVAVGVGALAVGEMAFLWHVSRMPARGKVGVALAADGVNPVELPAFLGTEWIGRRAEVSAVEREILPPDTGYSRKLYVNVADPRRQVFLSIVLNGRDRTSIHRPELCLVGQGWTVVKAVRHRFARPLRSQGDFPVTLLRVRREVQTPRGRAIVPQLVAYWFVGGDGVLPSHWQLFLRDAWQRVWQARADRWAYVLMQTDASDGEAAALGRLQDILDGALPTLQRAVGVEKP